MTEAAPVLGPSAPRRRVTGLAGLRRLHEAAVQVDAAVTPEALVADAAHALRHVFGAGAAVVATVGDRGVLGVATPAAPAGDGAAGGDAHRGPTGDADPSGDLDGDGDAADLDGDGEERALPCTRALAGEVAAAVAAGGALPPGGLPTLPVSLRPRAGYLGAPVAGRTGAHRGAVLVDAAVAVTPDQVGEARVALAHVAHAVGLALDRLRAGDVEHRIALTLQRSLLPEWAAPPPGLDAAVRYEAAPADAQVGGDFYELLELDRARVLAAVGDVVGHSPQAATVMAELRYALRAYALDGHGPAAVLERLDRTLHRFHPTTTASVCVTVLDRPARRLTVVNAGHPPPLVVGPGGVEVVADHGALLGVGLATPPTATVDLAPGATVLLVTDGLFERRGETVDDGVGRVAEVAHAWAGAAVEAGDEPSVEGLCQRLLDEVGPGAEATDDVALLAVRLLPR